MTIKTPDYIDELGLPVRTYNCLKRNGINTITELTQRSANDLLKIEDFNSQDLIEISLKLETRGMGLTLENRNIIKTSSDEQNVVSIKIIECPFCRSSWKLPDNIISKYIPDNCPFCGSKIIYDEINIGAILKSIVADYGKEIFKDTKRLSALISDYLYACPSIRIPLIHSLQEDIGIILYDASTVIGEQVNMKMQAAHSALKYLLVDERINEVLLLFAYALDIDWNYRKPVDYHDENLAYYLLAKEYETQAQKNCDSVSDIMEKYQYYINSMYLISADTGNVFTRKQWMERCMNAWWHYIDENKWHAWLCNYDRHRYRVNKLTYKNARFFLELAHCEYYGIGTERDNKKGLELLYNIFKTCPKSIAGVEAGIEIAALSLYDDLSQYELRDSYGGEHIDSPEFLLYKAFQNAHEYDHNRIIKIIEADKKLYELRKLTRNIQFDYKGNIDDYEVNRKYLSDIADQMATMFDYVVDFEDKYEQWSEAYSSFYKIPLFWYERKIEFEDDDYCREYIWYLNKTDIPDSQKRGSIDRCIKSTWQRGNYGLTINIVGNLNKDKYGDYYRKVFQRLWNLYIEKKNEFEKRKTSEKREAIDNIISHIVRYVDEYDYREAFSALSVSEVIDFLNNCKSYNGKCNLHVCLANYVVYSTKTFPLTEKEQLADYLYDARKDNVFQLDQKKLEKMDAGDKIFANEFASRCANTVCVIHTMFERPLDLPRFYPRCDNRFLIDCLNGNKKTFSTITMFFSFLQMLGTGIEKDFDSGLSVFLEACDDNDHANVILYRLANLLKQDNRLVNYYLPANIEGSTAIENIAKTCEDKSRIELIGQDSSYTGFATTLLSYWDENKLTFFPFRDLKMDKKDDRWNITELLEQVDGLEKQYYKEMSDVREIEDITLEQAQIKYNLSYKATRSLQYKLREYFVELIWKVNYTY